MLVNLQVPLFCPVANGMVIVVTVVYILSL